MKESNTFKEAETQKKLQTMYNIFSHLQHFKILLINPQKAS